MTDILNAVQHQGLAFSILVLFLLALHQGYIITKNHFDDYRGQRDKLDEELRRELQEKDKEIDEWQRIAGPQPLERIVEIVKAALGAAPNDRGSTP